MSIQHSSSQDKDGRRSCDLCQTKTPARDMVFLYYGRTVLVCPRCEVQASLPRHRGRSVSIAPT